ncbi:hypothetical protein SEA_BRUTONGASTER_115 [Gordonia phage BrutonGaster]|uniref:Uncharacterized protein n=1 Tax=Gordonia phage BrutonGaster TaxID=2530116 RepID=A0A482JMP0_9CAUD|nr:hypothetical protein HOV26_gp067 [Gordonia phage BrutonGaster]QBP33330.1 hypothetical protein SEA_BRUTONGASTER_115 [Gordonia phage BrutonGaster]
MAHYTVWFVNHTSAYMSVEADTPNEALDYADEHFEYPGLCHHCAGDREDGEWFAEAVEDADGNLVVQGLTP